MIDALRLYRLYVGISVRGQMQYRASFVMETIGQFGIVGVEFVGILVLFSRFDTLEGWTLPQVAFLYGLVHLGFSFADTFSRGFDSFGVTVRLGDFDRLLLRPRSTALQLMGKELVLRRLGRIVLALGVIAWASIGPGGRMDGAEGGSFRRNGRVRRRALLRADDSPRDAGLLDDRDAGGHEHRHARRRRDDPVPALDLPPVVSRHFHLLIPAGRRQLLPGRRHSGQSRPARIASLVPVRGPAIGFLFLLVCLRYGGSASATTCPREADFPARSGGEQMSLLRFPA